MTTRTMYQDGASSTEGKKVRTGEGWRDCSPSSLLPFFLSGLRIFLCFWLAGACFTWMGCAEQVRQPSPAELARFQAADQTSPTVDMDRVLQAKIATGPYRATPGDVLKLEMPRFLEQSSDVPTADNRQTYNCRIGDDGTIVLPIIGRVAVQDKTLAEIERAIAAQYYPKYVAAPLPVYASVLEYQTQRVSIVGAVTQPGIHALRYDQMSLVALLMQAGGIVGQGAAVIRITRADGPTPGPLLENGKPKIVPSSVLRPASYQTRSPAPRAVFEREGPLRTTGWLQVEGEDGEVCYREWLDVGNEPQRREFLSALALRSQQVASEDLETRFAQLGAYLEEMPKTGHPGSERTGTKTLPFAPRPLESGGPDGLNEVGDATDSPGLPSGWRALGQGTFMTAVVSTRGAENQPDVTVVSNTPVRKDPNGAPVSGIETLVLPVRGLNIPFADVTLAEGDTVVVEPPREQSVAIVGLVTHPGNMPYPPGTRYNLIQAIAYAGGLDLVADPRYVCVYRLAPDGEIVSARFQLVNPHREQQLTETLALPLKPGDVVSVEHTPRTRMNVFFDRVFRITLGLYVDPLNTWD
jgi:protein involved in polysaccharide export with SLBB domain